MGTHELDSAMLYIHPPLAVMGYVFVFIFTALLFFGKKTGGKWLKPAVICSWIFTFLGLVTGMLWAQVAWGSYWSWDPKENMTLVLFLSVSACLVCVIEKRRKETGVFAAASCILSVLTVAVSFISLGLHSF